MFLLIHTIDFMSVSHTCNIILKRKYFLYVLLSICRKLVLSINIRIRESDKCKGYVILWQKEKRREGRRGEREERERERDLGV